MSEAMFGLIGVIIGGLIATVTQLITSFFNYSKWKKEMKVNHLRLKQDKLEKAFDKAKERLIAGVMNNSYDIDMVTDFVAIFPKKVFQTFHKMTKAKPRREDEKRKHIFKVMTSMKESLNEIETMIEKEMRSFSVPELFKKRKNKLT